jgi:glycine dehydrogenase subunit 2
MELIFAQSRPGRCACNLPKLDVPAQDCLPDALRRTKPVALPEVTELDAVRHFTNLSRLNFSVDSHFYPLGSCTMKYNPKAHEVIARMPGFTTPHPRLLEIPGGSDALQGTLEVLYREERFLSELFGFAETTLQPMAGANGEFTGVMLIAAWCKKQGQSQRKVMLIPDSAHGTNPASAAQAGFICREIKSDAGGNLDLDDLKAKLGPDVAGLMLTCPNTVGMFNHDVKAICDLVHQAGGLCYCDGANANAIVGRVRPGDLGFDVMHVNVHKTFSTPHGGGGPGAGPVCVKENLQPFLPKPRIVKNADGTFALDNNCPESIGHIAPFLGSFAVLLRSCAYMLNLGREGMRRVSENAVLNANYLRVKLAPFFDQQITRDCMHECVFSATRSKDNGVHALDIAKALIDRGFHPPTIYFPLIIPEALMIEPTETESKETLDAFIAAMQEIASLAASNPEALLQAPLSTPVRRLDETGAARHPDLASLED